MARVTFSLDEETVGALRRTASRLRMPQSQVVREAIADYASRADRLDAHEQARLLGVLERLRTTPPTRPAAAVEAELRAVRAGRRAGGRRRAVR